MSGRFCGSCGAPVGPDSAFCASCGTPVASHAAVPQAPPAVQPPTAEQPAAAPPQAAQHAPPPATAPFAQPQPGQYGQPAGVPYGQPQPGVPYGAPQNGAPWGAVPPPGAVGSGPTPGRSVIDALLTGDWGGAARAAGFAVLAMLGLGLGGMLLLTGGEVGAREILVLTVGAVCAAVGGDIYAETASEDFFDGPSFASSTSFGVLPLTLTLAGLALMGWLFARSLRGRAVSTRDVLLQGARTALVFTACFLVLSLLSRYRADDQELFDLSGQIGVSVWSSLMGALLFAVATLGIVWLFSGATSATLPPRLAAFRAQAVAPLVGAVAVFGAGLLGVFVALIYGLVELDERVAQFGILVLGGGNGMLASILWSAGVPLNADAGVTGGLSDFTGGSASGEESIDLFTFTDANGWFWLAPVALLLILLAVATVLTVRQNSVEDARREGFRFAGALAVVALLAALLLRIAGGADGGFDEFGGGSGDVSATFNPIVAAFALGVWGVVAGLLGPVLATKVSSNLVMGLRNRFGAAPPRPVAPPAPAAPVAQQWQQPAVQYQQPYAPQPHAPEQQAYAPPQQPPYGQQQPHPQQAPYPQQQPLPPVPPVPPPTQ